MLNFISSKGWTSCDRITRRDLIRVGGLGMCGLTLADLLWLKASAAAGATQRTRSVIMIVLAGGASHIDTFDMKPDAPAEVRGEFRPIATRLPGLEICELMPRIAQIADKLSLVRSLEMGFNDHANQCEVTTGYPAKLTGGQAVFANRPAFGSVVSRLGQPPAAALPRFVSLTHDSSDYRRLEYPAYLGPAHEPFVPYPEGLKNLSLAEGISAERLHDRSQLRQTFDRLRRDLDAKGHLAGIDTYTAQALELVTSKKVRDAFDLSREPPSALAKYGDPAVAKVARQTSGGYAYDPAKFLLARRLVEAGVPVVSLFLGGWDHHGRVDREKLGIFEKLQGMLPAFDAFLAGLLTDLADHGLDREVSVVVWGEFGRGPRVDKFIGRDHWPAANFAILSGGGLQAGQVIGSTDAQGANVHERPLSSQHVLATLYHLLGIDPSQTLPDYQGRPMYVLDRPEPIPELLSV
jgi:hypothetical protein